MTATPNFFGNRRWAAIGAVLLCLPLPTTAAGIDDVARCAGIDDDSSRLACYDKVAGRVRAVRAAEADVATPPAAAPVPAAAPSPATPHPVAAIDDAAAAAPAQAAAAPAEQAPAQLTDEFGAERLEGRSGGQEISVRATVTGCRQDASDRYYFYFDNGQVWKQKDSRRLHYRQCEFDVTISRDFFGYKMQLDGDDKTTRIDRIR
jgi:hypothetical protein